jgi:hypothetical protein
MLARASSVVTRKAPPATLAETKRGSLRSLTDHAPKTPKSPCKKKQKDSHLRSLLGIRRDVPDNKSIVSPVPSVKKTSSPSIQTMLRKDESTGSGKRGNRACPRRQLSMLIEASAASSQKNDEHTLKDVLDEYAKIIDDFRKAAYWVKDLKKVVTLTIHFQHSRYGSGALRSFPLLALKRRR